MSLNIIQATTMLFSSTSENSSVIYEHHDSTNMTRTYYFENKRCVFALLLRDGSVVRSTM